MASSTFVGPIDKRTTVQFSREQKTQINNIAKSLQIQLQEEKLKYSTDAIKWMRSEGHFPEEDEGIISFHTSTHRDKRYDDISRFYSYMAKSPKLWNKRFIFVAKTNERENIMAASEMAIEIAALRVPVDKGNLLASLRYYVDGYLESDPVRKMEQTEGNPIFAMRLSAEYASSVEARSYFGIGKAEAYKGGILYYAAQRVARKFPSLAVIFNYEKGLGHQYDIPVIHIGSKDDVQGRFSKPGRRQRDRVKLGRRASRILTQGLNS